MSHGRHRTGQHARPGLPRYAMPSIRSYWARRGRVVLTSLPSVVGARADTALQAATSVQGYHVAGAEHHGRLRGVALVKVRYAPSSARTASRSCALIAAVKQSISPRIGSG